MLGNDESDVISTMNVYSKTIIVPNIGLILAESSLSVFTDSLISEQHDYKLGHFL